MHHVGPVIESSAVFGEGLSRTAGYTQHLPLCGIICPGIDTRVQGISVLYLIQMTRQPKSQARWSVMGISNLQRSDNMSDDEFKTLTSSTH
jgi:hypothetical protein